MLMGESTAEPEKRMFLRLGYWQNSRTIAGCSTELAGKAAAGGEAMRTLCGMEPLRAARTPPAALFSTAC
jgi:hypothetical protein